MQSDSSQLQPGVEYDYAGAAELRAAISAIGTSSLHLPSMSGDHVMLTPESDFAFSFTLQGDSVQSLQEGEPLRVHAEPRARGHNSTTTTASPPAVGRLPELTGNITSWPAAAEQELELAEVAAGAPSEFVMLGGDDAYSMFGGLARYAYGSQQAVSEYAGQITLLAAGALAPLLPSAAADAWRIDFDDGVSSVPPSFLEVSAAVGCAGSSDANCSAPPHRLREREGRRATIMSGNSRDAHGLQQEVVANHRECASLRPAASPLLLLPPPVSSFLESAAPSVPILDPGGAAAVSLFMQVCSGPRLHLLVGARQQGLTVRPAALLDQDRHAAGAHGPSPSHPSSFSLPFPHSHPYCVILEHSPRRLLA